MEFTAVVAPVGRARAIVPVPFDPGQVWGPKPRHHISGTVGGHRVRAVIETVDGGFGFALGPAWLRDCEIEPGAEVAVRIGPEGPQRDDLPADLAEALAAEPAAAKFFDGLAQFYRKAYLTWIDGTRRSPQARAGRIATVVHLLSEGRKTRPKP